MVLPMYVTIDWKPKNGYEIQIAACGQSGVMLCLRLVKTAEEGKMQTQLRTTVGTTMALQ